VRDEDEAGWIADRLSSARADAERIGRELVAKGHLTDDQLGAIAGAIDTAIARGRTLIADALREPRRVLDELRAGVASERDRVASGTPDGTLPDASRGDAARLDALERRIEALERALRNDRPAALPGNRPGGGV